MRFFNPFRKLDREHWFICYKCLGDTDHNEVKSVFHSLAPKVLVVGRPWQQCPRCGSTNTKSFAELRDEGLDSALWGLERIVKKNPRHLFEVEPGAAGPNGQAQSQRDRIHAR